MKFEVRLPEIEIRLAAAYQIICLIEQRHLLNKVNQNQPINIKIKHGSRTIRNCSIALAN